VPKHVLGKEAASIGETKQDYNIQDTQLNGI